MGLDAVQPQRGIYRILQINEDFRLRRKYEDVLPYLEHVQSHADLIDLGPVVVQFLLEGAEGRVKGASVLLWYVSPQSVHQNLKVGLDN